MIERELLEATYRRALPYEQYVATGTPAQRADWAEARRQVRPTDQHRALCATFTRRMHLLVSSGTWCGDCVQQVPMLDAIASLRPELIQLRIFDRDEHPQMARRLMINDGLRVPVVVFMNELFDFVSALGDRTLSRYRAVAARQMGVACPLPGAPVAEDEMAATLQDWMNEVERVQWICRLSPKLRALHGD